MQQRNHYWAIVPAAGIGQRFGCDLPKQYAQLGGREVILHSLQALAIDPSRKGEQKTTGS